GADFTGNVSGIDGGAIYGTIVTVSGGLFEDNHADTGMGGAIGNSTSANAITLDNVEMKNNSAAFGGALYADEIYVTGSYFDGNTAISAGGAVYVHDIVQINTTTFIQNNANFEGGALYQELTNVASVEHFITNSAFIKNGAGMNGGAIVTGSMPGLNLANSTISKNSADLGGGIFIFNTASLIATNVTFADNIAGITGGGLYKVGEASLQNTILNANTNDNCVTTATPFISLGNNIVSDTSCNLGGPEDMNNVDPLLDDLAPNGGATLTQALLPGSPAFNAGNDTACAGGFVNG
ncbi:MAG: hypothetical protein GY803_01975, partial [Chloroflexi bacterium]|nr:hypothetical protein [Chloroflexota bacterium]